MRFIFVTRCYKPDNLDQVKKSVQDAFKNSAHTYEQIIVVDLTHGAYPDVFHPFIDDNTSIVYVTRKESNDPQLSQGMDEALSVLHDEDAYVFVLDDDNLLHPDFLAICDECHGEDAIIFRIENRMHLGGHEVLDMNPVGHIDWANYITRLPIMQRLKIYHPEGPLRCSDGVFFDYMKRNNCTFHFVNRALAWYNKLR